MQASFASARGSNDEVGRLTPSSACFQAIVEGFGPFKSSISRLLLAEGIGKKGPDGMVLFEADGWYPLERELSAWKRTLDEVGSLQCSEVR